MKKSSVIFGIILLAGTILAQAPQSFKYQAIARDAEGNILSNKTINLRISIVSGIATGDAVFTETHKVQSNQFGILTLAIGTGEVINGYFSRIDWSRGNYFVSLDIDENGGTDFKPMGSSQLLSVPYALYAKESGTSASLSTGSSGSSKLGNDWITTGLNTYLSDPNSRVGIGTNSPLGILDIAGKYHFPDVDGINGQVLQTNGSGTLNWSDKDEISGINDLTDGVSIGKSVFLGANAGGNDDGTDNKNAGLGFYALRQNTYGDRNTAIGYAALYKNTSGSKNVANGFMALYKNTTGYRNTASGYAALHNNTTGNYNVGIGLGANYNNQAGSMNTTIGYMAGQGTALHDKSGNVFLGYKAGFNETGSSKLYIENSISATPLIYGDFSVDSASINGELNVTGTIQSGSSIIIDGVNDKITASGGSISFDNDNIVTEGKIGIGIGTTPPSSDLEVNGSFQVENGTSINEISTDTTLADNSDDAVPTEKAVKAYVDALEARVVELESRSITTAPASEVCYTIAVGGGNIGAGMQGITGRGVCWSTSVHPTIENDTTIDGNGTGSYISQITGLSVSTTYFVRAYASVNTGTIYGNEVSFTTGSCGSSFTDIRDGNTYNTVLIGQQCWMTENLAYLPVVNPPNSGNNVNPYYYVYDYQGTDVVIAKASSNYLTYGVLYNWPAAMAGQGSSNSVPSGVQGVCPIGWHLPSDEEWKVLEMYLGMTQAAANSSGFYRGTDQGSKLKSTCCWYDHGNGTNSSGFTALPGGNRFQGIPFWQLGSNADFWSSSGESSNRAWNRHLFYRKTGVFRNSFPKSSGLSVRCTKD